MSSNDNTSTLKATIDGVTGAVQNAIGSITGSNADQVCLGISSVSINQSIETNHDVL